MTSGPSLCHVFPWIQPKITVHLSIQTHRLVDEPDFDAVSYVWGEAPVTVTVMCNDAPLLITPTALEMLENIQRYKRPLWMDAICINQQDPDEKATQIPLMQRIYALADQVVVWLGASSPFINLFMAAFPSLWDFASRWRPTKMTSNADWRGAEWPADDNKLWVGLYQVLANAWFWRLWTFQEIVLARRAVMVCGPATINAIDFFTFVRNGFFRDRGYLKYIRSVASCILEDLTLSHFAYTLCDLITSSRKTFAEHGFAFDLAHLSGSLYDLETLRVKEPVDRIWAIAGLLPKNILERLASSVDYSVEGRKEYWRTYVTFAKTVFDSGQSLHLLTMGPPQGKRDMRLPSWCPDFSQDGACTIHFDLYHWNRPIESLGYRIARLLFDEDDKEKSNARSAAIEDHPLRYISAEEDDLLHVRGYVLDSVSDVVDYPYIEGPYYLPFTADFWHWAADYTMLSNAARFYSKGHDLAQRVLGGSQDDLDNIPPEFLMAIFADCRDSGV